MRPHSPASAHQWCNSAFKLGTSSAPLEAQPGTDASTFFQTLQPRRVLARGTSKYSGLCACPHQNGGESTQEQMHATHACAAYRDASGSGAAPARHMICREPELTPLAALRASLQEHLGWLP